MTPAGRAVSRGAVRPGPAWNDGPVTDAAAPDVPDAPAASPAAARVADRARLADVEPAIALGPLDGRYRPRSRPLVDHLSEAALNRERLHVEVEWLLHLDVAPRGARVGRSCRAEDQAYLRDVVATFGADEVAELAAIERETVHDVKAVEYFLKRRIAAAPDALGARHGAAVGVASSCTSRAPARTSTTCRTRSWCGAPSGRSGCRPRTPWSTSSPRWRASTPRVPMLARTHGQPATPTTLGKELAVLAHRLRRQLRRVEGAEYLGKLNGATGTYGAHVVAVPAADWPAVSRTFVEGLGLTWNPLTTQIESHDWQAELYADVARFNRILHNLATDVWTYISLGYFAQIPVAGATGSSTMPHKVNPIRFENAEANLEISSALLDTLAATLVTSRLQRDLTDSTTQRNIGPAFGHSLLAIDNVRRGLRALHVDADLHGPGPRRQLGGPRRAGPVRDARGRRRRGHRHGEPVRAAQGADARPPARRGRTCGRSSRASACPTTSRRGSRR